MSATKDERMTVRLTHDQLALFKDAAEAEGRTLTDFAVATLTAHAHDVLAEQRVFRLTGARWDELMAMLDAPPQARPRLADALRSHGGLVDW